MCKNGNGNGRLTDKQALFIEKYLQCFNATEACRGVYDSDDDNTLASIGSENLRKPKIAEKISQRLQESAMSADEVLARLAEQARGEIGAYIRDDGTVEFERIVADGKAHLLKKVHKTTRFTKSGDEIVRLTVETYDAQRALELIGKYHKLFVDRTELTGAEGGAIVLQYDGNVDPDEV